MYTLKSKALAKIYFKKKPFYLGKQCSVIPTIYEFIKQLFIIIYLAEILLGLI